MHPKGLAWLFVYMYFTLKLLTAGQTTVNVANISGRTCTQSSNYSNTNSPCAAANNDTGGTYSGSNCIHTNETSDREPWFEVDLGSTFPVSSVKVWGRNGFITRQYPFTITVDNQHCATVGTGGREQSVTCTSVLYGRKVRLTRGYKNNDFPLNLCEMEILVPEGVSECAVDKCTSDCSDNCGGGSGSNFCDSSTGNCYGCVAGYYGNLCDMNCSFSQNKNNRCTACSQSTGQNCTACSGYFQPPECTGCVAGYYGDLCDINCSFPQNTNKRCTACSQSTGQNCTACSGTFQLPECTDCPNGNYSSNNECLRCSDKCLNWQCDQGTGKCNGCVMTRWGDQCEKTCNSNCLSITCDRGDGSCDDCVSGYHGDQCDKPCPSIVNTNNRCNKCMQNGMCTGCDEHFQFPGCAGCVMTRWGDQCEKTCSSNCVSNTCDRGDGSCDGCVMTRWGDQCEETCSNNCVSNTCDRGNGRCDACPGGRWGFTCEEECNNCASTPCDRSNGHCNDDGCKQGYHGDRCDQRCSTILHHCDTCSQTGDCMGCGGNTVLPGCTVCKDEYYREKPSNPNTTCSHCTWQCGGDKPCNKMTGDCDQCPDGKNGTRCEHDCDDNRYGPTRCSLYCGQCEGNAQCNPATGECPRCEPGWYPPLCQKACRNKTYGLNCKDNCGQCQGGQPCANDTGECTEGCEPGWTAPLCKAECDAGLYGEGCNSTCGNCQFNTTCTHVFGECLQGCTDGYEGRLCMQATAGPEILIAAAVAGVILAILVVAVIVIVIIIIRRRKNKGKSTDSAHEEPAVMSSSVEVRASKADVSYNSAPQASAYGAADGDGLYENITMSNIAPTTVPNKRKPPVAVKPTQRRESDSHMADSLEPLPDYGVEEDVSDYDSEAVYGNILPTKLCLNVLQNTIAEKLHEGTFNDEFRRLNPNKDYSVKNGKGEEHYFKNRYDNITPYDKNRVVLEEVDDDDSSDYINASFIKGVKSDKAYIAAQGPKSNTVDDFWRMVWQEGVTDIVMLTNVMEGDTSKCHEYWPAPGQTLDKDHVEVTALWEETRAHYVIRTFDISGDEGEDKRRVTQYHYVSWMDHEVPAATPLVDFWRYVRARAPRAPSAPPLLVHCSAGVGRTGTYIALDVAIDRAQDATEVNVYNIVDRLRDDRCHMVQNKAQYAFLHEAVLEAYSGRDARMGLVAMGTVLQPDIRHHTPDSRLDKEFETLCKMRDRQTEPTFTAASLPENVDKNRNKNILPNDKHSVFLTQHIIGNNQYINAVYMPTFEKQRGSIMTQLPLPGTVVDMWRLVDGCDVNLIVSIGDVDKNQACYWPQKEGTSLPAVPYTISQKYMSKVGDTISSYTVAMKKNGASRDVRVLHLHGWTGEVADSTDDLVYLLTTLQAAAKDSAGPVVLQCIDGASNSGVVCVLSDVISRMTRDSELDVYVAVRQLHAVRPQALTSVTQYRYCYEVAQHFIYFRNSFNVYANT